jgi:hypothetical protein
MAICAELKRATPTVPVGHIDELYKIFKDPEVTSTIDSVRAALEQERLAIEAGLESKAKEYKKEANRLKASLPGIIFQASSFKEHEWIDSKNVNHGMGAWRHQDHVMMNGLFIVDIDHVENPQQLWNDLINKKVMDWKPFFVFVSPSGKGLKLVLPCDINKGNIAANQKAFGEAFGVAVDEKCKDASRLTFVSKFEDILFSSNEICTYENKEYVAKWNGRYNDGSADGDLFKSDSPQPADGPADATVADAGKFLGNMLRWMQAAKGEFPTMEEYEDLKYRGLKVEDLINEYFSGKAPEQGDRHDSMMRFVRDVRHILDNNHRAVVYWTLRLPFVQHLWKEGDNIARDIMDSLAYKYSPYMPQQFKTALKKLKSQELEEPVSNLSEDLINQRYLEFGEQFKELFKYYPCMKECVNGFAVSSYPAVLFSAACMYGTLATRLYYFHYHEPEQQRRLNYEVFVIADPASGKSGIGKLYKIIMAPLIAEDKVYNDSINKNKKARKVNESVKDKERKKIDVVESKVRIHGSRTANNVFIEDMVNNVEEIDGELVHLHLFTFDAELEAAQQASKGGQWIDKTIFELKAFHNEEDNQQYRNVDSISGPFDVYWNLVYTGTPYSLYRKVNERNFGSGLSTRLAVIPLAPEKYKMMPFNRNARTNQGYNETMKMWAFRMDGVKGELPIWPLVEHTWKWTNDLMNIAGQSNDEALAFLIKRVSYYGINCSVPFILMRHWEEWQEKKTLTIDEKDLELCELFMEVQLFSQKNYFGKMTEKYCENSHRQVEEQSSENLHTKTVAMLRQQPNEITANALAKTCGISKDYARVLIQRWLKDELIIQKDNKRPRKYQKTKKGEIV